jgi:H+/Cl- antiporter ClcA
MGDITSANSSFVLTVAQVFAVPQILQGYGADDAFTQEKYQLAETRMGVDGILSGGYTPTPKRLTVNLQPDSVALATFLRWAQSVVAAKTSFTGKATILYPSVSLGFTLGTIFFEQTQGMPSAKKILDTFSVDLVYQDLTSFPI